MKEIDPFQQIILEFMSQLHDCHNCRYVQGQIHKYNGRQRVFCGKYNKVVKYVRWECVDRFPGFDNQDITKIMNMYRAGTIKCDIDLPIEKGLVL